MDNINIFVFATISPKSEYVRAAKNELIKMLPVTRDEKGCIQFEIHESENGNLIHLYEEWTSKNALENHHHEPHTKRVAKKFEDWLSAPTTVSIMKKLS